MQLGEVRLVYAEAGQGAPLVLLHGGLDDHRAWSRQLSGLADEFRVLAWDAPGHGRSSDVPDTWRMPDYADAAAAWLDAHSLGRAHILGRSWGSSVALELYRRHPQLPRSLILAGAYAGWAGSLPAEEVTARLQGALAAADLPVEESMRAWPGVFSPAASSELRDEFTAIWAENAGASNPGAYRAMAHSMAEADLRDVLGRIAVPTFLMYGERDERSPPRVARELHGAIPTSELVFIPGVGHLVHVEAPEAFNAHVRRFLRTTGPRRRPADGL